MDFVLDCFIWWARTLDCLGWFTFIFMKLFIDDIRNAPDDKWSVARTVSEAIRFIAFFGKEIEEISLDHDISHQVGMGKLSRPYPCEETFAAVAYYIREYYKGEKHPRLLFIRPMLLGLKQCK